jgi:anti-sigma-K factor RskA
MNCDDIRELLPAFALGAIPERDAGDVRAHLATCRQHDAELAEFESVAASLPLAAEEREPTPELRQRLLSAFDAELNRTQAAPTSEPARIVPFVRRQSLGWLAAASLFVAVIGLGIWNVMLQTNDEGSGSGWTVSADLTGAGVDGHFWYLERRQLAVVSMDEMPELPAGRVFQAWGIYDGEPVSLGVMPHETTVAMKADLTGATMFAITEEPEGGSDQPTSDPVASVELS